uniref:Evasin n=1 Tax=Rhipicephalus appendiculatus TaxID=34631 RepID=A0A131YCS3_RHIAP
MGHQQNTIKFFLRCSVVAGIVISLSSGFDILLERSSSEGNKNDQVSSSGTLYGDCLDKDDKPINNGSPCALVVIPEERKASSKQTCAVGVCKNGTCTNIDKTECANN